MTPGFLAQLLVSFALLLVAMSVHEFAHGWVAYRLGDTTAKFSGRLTLNPLAHIDPFGTLLLPLILFIMTGGRFVFGAAKPVPVNYWALKNPKRDMIWIGLAGPMANLLVAVIISILFRVLPVAGYLGALLINFLTVNVLLGVFNLVPVPPLDGSRIAMGLLPEELSRQYIRIEPYGFMIVVLMIGLGLFEMLVFPIVNTILSLLLS